ncbi:MAG: tyrosine-type recombinase/integrase [Longimicrobiales bacterium]
MGRKLWRTKVEVAGQVVTVYERANSDALWYSATVDGKRVRRSLKTSDRETAVKRAKAIAKRLAEAVLTGRDLRTLTLAEVFGHYFRRKAPTLTDRWRSAAETRRDLFLGAWGREKPVGDIGQSDIDRFRDLRRSGVLRPENSRTKGVRDGTIEADLRWLSTVFRWARGVKVNGNPMIPANPLEGLKRPEPKNVRRPVASHDRYLRTMEQADQVDPEGRLRCMLALARFTGRRESSICQLRADDVLRTPEAVRRALAAMGLDESAAEHFPRGGIRWRAETDKQGYHAVTPLSAPAREALDTYLEQNPRLGAVPLFSAPKDPSAPIRKDTAGNWLMRSERLAGLPKLAGGRWHPYRRLFATELRALPVHDVAAAGGWRSVETVQRIYQRAEAKGVLEAIEAAGRA